MRYFVKIVAARILCAGLRGGRHRRHDDAVYQQRESAYGSDRECQSAD